MVVTHLFVGGVETNHIIVRQNTTKSHRRKRICMDYAIHTETIQMGYDSKNEYFVEEILCFLAHRKLIQKGVARIRTILSFHIVLIHWFGGITS